MGYVIAMANCYGCGQPFTFNPLVVPSVRDQNGVRQALCQNCSAEINRRKRQAGMPEVPIHPNAYEGIDENELPLD